MHTVLPSQLDRSLPQRFRFQFLPRVQIAGALPQRRNMDGEVRNAVEQVLAEMLQKRPRPQDRGSWRRSAAPAGWNRMHRQASGISGLRLLRFQRRLCRPRSGVSNRASRAASPAQPRARAHVPNAQSQPGARAARRSQRARQTPVQGGFAAAARALRRPRAARRPGAVRWRRAPARLRERRAAPSSPRSLSPLRGYEPNAQSRPGARAARAVTPRPPDSRARAKGAWTALLVPRRRPR